MSRQQLSWGCAWLLLAQTTTFPTTLACLGVCFPRRTMWIITVPTSQRLAECLQ